MPAEASVDPLAGFVRARVAEQAGASDEAARAYGAALAADPGNEVLAGRTLSQAIAAGDRPLALKAARLLDAAGKLPPHGRFLLLGEALRGKDEKVAARHIEAIAGDEIFSFLAPLLRAWVQDGKGATLETPDAKSLLASYAAEHRPLLLIASGRRKEGAAALASLVTDDSIRSQRVRIAAAALLARKGDRKEALALLPAQEGGAVAIARREIEAGRRLAGQEIAGPQAALAELLSRVALDLNGAQVPQLALDFARLSTLLAPENGAGWVVVAELLSATGQSEAALGALSHVSAADPFATAATERRMLLLAGTGHRDEALAQARTSAEAEPKSADSWLRLADLLSEAERHDEAADAYGRAVELSEGGGSSGRTAWSLWLLRGSALTQAGRWNEGKAAVEQALKLAPNQAVVLNFLGYSQLERRENVVEAERLIREASKLQPDDPAITDSLGWALYMTGRVPEAIELLERASKGQPSDAAISEHLGDAYYSAGRRYEARYAWRAALAFAEGAAAKRIESKIDSGLRPDLAAP
jgi:Flp pilus assembly protein TadD